MRKNLSALIVLLLFAVGSYAQGVYRHYAHHAVVRIPSHGGSGVVIYTQENRSYIISAAHMFEGKDRAKKIKLDIPVPRGTAPKNVGVYLLATDAKKDLALIELRYGPLPYVAPVAPKSKRLSKNQWLLSVGFDEMRKPPRMRWVKYQGTYGTNTFTDKPPWHGRSGGALIDMRTGSLVGVVSGYEEPYPQGRGLYVSLPAVHKFLANYGGGNTYRPKVREERLPQQQLAVPQAWRPQVIEQRY